MSIFFVVQSFSRQKRGALTPDPQTKAVDERHAVRVAERLQPQKAGVLAYCGSYDEDSGEVGDFKLLFLAGDIPETARESLPS